MEGISHVKDMTPFMCAISRGNLGIASLLAKRGANINARNKDGKTPLMDAAKRGDLLSLQLLIELGADLEILNRGASALFYAIGGRSLMCIKALLDAGANVNIEAMGYTPLEAAILKGDEDVGQFMYKHLVKKDNKWNIRKWIGAGKIEEEEVDLMEYLVKESKQKCLFAEAVKNNNVKLMRYIQSR